MKERYPHGAKGRLTFDDRLGAHTYRYNGVEIPSVSSLLKPIQPDYGFASSETGTRVHKLLEAVDKGTIRQGGELRGYVEGWVAFKRHTGYRSSHVETMVYHPTLRYAGTVDRIGTINGAPCVLDIKTGQPDRWHGVQLAAYEEAARGDLFEGTACRIGVYLSADATFKVVRYQETSDVSALAACISFARATRQIDVWLGRR